MNCTGCGFEDVPEGARFCPNCGTPMPELREPSTQIAVTQDVGSVQGGVVTGVDLGSITGDVTIESTLNQIETHIVQGDFVDRSVITNSILVLGDPNGLEALVERLMAMQGVDKRAPRNVGALSPPENIDQQIGEVMAAHEALATQGLPATAETLCGLGALAAYRRDYDAALGYYQEATQLDSELSDAFEGIAWVKQVLAMHDIDAHHFDEAHSKLTQARSAAARTDPLDPEALVLRGYIAKTLAQLADLRHDGPGRKQSYEEAARFFQHVTRLEPGNAEAHNGLGNVAYAAGHLDAAIAAYGRAVELSPEYVAAYHDLAAAFESKMQADPANADTWCQKALQAWRRTYQLAPNDPNFSADYILMIGQRVLELEQSCG